MPTLLGLSSRRYKKLSTDWGSFNREQLKCWVMGHFWCLLILKNNQLGRAN